MSSAISRRTFVRVATVSTLGLAGAFGNVSITRAREAGDDGDDRPLYAFVLLGDLHFDKMAHHDMDWVRREKAGDVRQIEGYVAGTAKYHPLLFAEVREAIKAQKVPVPFVIQVGDLVEGLCGSFDLQALQFRDTMKFIDDAALGAPFLITKGNHDITGPGAPEAFDQVLLPWLSKQAGQELSRAHYVHRHADDAFVFFDAYKPDLDWLEQALRDNGKARHVFVIVHPPVVPYNARSNWHVFAADQQRESRARLLAALGRHRAIVLSGHLHKYSLVTRRTDAGSFVQLSVSSIIRNDREAPRQMLDGIDRYTPDLIDLEPGFSPGTIDRRRELLKAEAPLIERFEFADLPGYALVKVFADRVVADVYAGVGTSMWRSRDVAARAMATTPS